MHREAFTIKASRKIFNKSANFHHAFFILISDSPIDTNYKDNSPSLPTSIWILSATHCTPAWHSYAGNVSPNSSMANTRRELNGEYNRATGEKKKGLYGVGW